MSLRKFLATVCGLGLLLIASEARAQYYQTYRPPGRFGTQPGGFQRYPSVPGARLPAALNLVGDNDLAVRYFLRTLPEVERRQNAALFDTRLQYLESATVPETSLTEIPGPERGAARPPGTRRLADYYPLEGGRARLARPGYLPQTPPR